MAVRDLDTVRITRALRVLHRGGTSEIDVWFGPMEEGEDGEPFFGAGTHVLTMEDYREMGEPEAITVAIYPGDRQDLMERGDFPA